MKANILEQIAEIERTLQELKEYANEEINDYCDEVGGEEFYKTDSMIDELKRQNIDYDDESIKRQNLQWINLLEYNQSV